jgi:hypothetical protein
VRLEGLSKLKKSNYLVRNQIRYLPDCSIVPQLRYRVHPGISNDPQEVAREVPACQRRSAKRRQILNEQRRLDSPSEDNFREKILKLEL